MSELVHQLEYYLLIWVKLWTPICSCVMQSCVIIEQQILSNHLENLNHINSFIEHFFDKYKKEHYILKFPLSNVLKYFPQLAQFSLKLCFLFELFSLFYDSKCLNRLLRSLSSRHQFKPTNIYTSADHVDFVYIYVYRCLHKWLTF